MDGGSTAGNPSAASAPSLPSEGQHKDQSPSEGQHKDRSPPEGQHKDRSPSEGQHKDQSPSEGQHKDLSPSEGQHKDRSPSEGQHKDRSPSEGQHKDQSPPEGQHKDLSPPEGQHQDWSPSEGQHQDQSPSEGQHKDRSPSEGQHKDRSPSEGQHKDRSPVKKDQRPEKGQHKDRSPSKGQHKDQSPVKGQRKDLKPDKLKPDLLPTEQQKLDGSEQTVWNLPKNEISSDQEAPEGPKADQTEQEKLEYPTVLTRSDPTKPDPEKPGDPFSSKHEQNQTEGDLSSDLTAQKTKEDLPPAEQESKDQQDQQDPPPEKSRSVRPEDHQDPPLPQLLNSQQDPRPPAQQNHRSSSVVSPPETLAPPTQAPPLQIQTPPTQTSSILALPLHTQAPPTHTSTIQTPPLQAPPTQTPPLETPPLQTQAPPTQTPTLQAPPTQTPPIQTPPTQTPPLQAPPTQTPPLSAPPLKTLAPPTQTPPLLAPPPTIEAFCSLPPQGSSSGEPKLCGFLQKQGGPLRAWKQRWFTHEERKNELFYYRTPQDVAPLGRVELSSATFSYPLKGERGTFHIKTPERTFILKAVSQELMLYWLQQLQLKRWQHRETSTCSDQTAKNTANNNAKNAKNGGPDDFLPVLSSPLGLVGEEAANVASPRAPLADVSLKHPLITIQNSVHSLRKRSSQECSQSVFHLDTPPWTPPKPGNSSAAAPQTSTEPMAPPPSLSLAKPVAPPSSSLTEPLATPSSALTSPHAAPPSQSLSSLQAPPPSLLLAAPVAPPPSLSLSEPVAPPPLLPLAVESPGRSRKSRGSSTLPSLRRNSAERSSRLQQEKHMLMEEVKAQKELVWILHRALEASQLEKRCCAEFVSAEGEQQRLELLRHGERRAAELRRRLDDAEAKMAAATATVAQRDAQLAELQRAVTALTEKNNAKQEVIIKLSDQVTACMSDPRLYETTSQTFRQLQQETENLKDDIEAYKTQNKFLNSEIYQLTKLWRNSSEQEKSLMVKCAYLEASTCQMESRYLGVLRQLQEVKSLDPAQRGAVQKMIEVALKGEMKGVVKVNLARDYDEYGFKIIPDYEVEDMKLLAKIQALEIRSHNLLHQEGVERPLLARWAHYLAGRSDLHLCASPELKSLVRAGVPQVYRQRMWRWVIRTRTRTIRERHPQRYQQLCEKSRTSPHPASRQIQLDLHRTLTTNQNFSSPSSPALQQLRCVLLAFSWQNPAIGYCQGLNRLAAIALLVLQSEEDAFWCLVAVVETIMPQDYYTKNLVASQADQRVLKDFLAEKLPRLAAHFEDHSVDVSLVTFNWLLVVFVESLPSDILLPLWDAFLYEGTKVMFRYALALFKYKEDDILKIHDSVEIYQYLRFFTKTVCDGRRLTAIAFSDMNPFPGRLLRSRRALHLERLQAELRELEEQQRQFVTESAARKDKELDTTASEDDDDI